MIVDMMRNDLGRIARRGGVEVLSTFDIEKYPTVWQMTSTVQAHSDASVVATVLALFPPASCTGAPKVRTMQIIRELEKDPRGIYTGMLGYFGPGGKARFNVAIRTVVIDRATGQAEFGTGGGIVWDSDPAEEFAECLTKAAVLAQPVPPFDLLETLLYEEGTGYFLLERHLERLSQSADYFDVPLDLGEIRRRLDEEAALVGGGDRRIRLRVDQKGQVFLEATPLARTTGLPWTLKLAERPVDPKNVFLYHKTTYRAVYETARATREDCDDVVLWNDQGQATETTIANLVVEKAGRLITPPVACGLLPGVFRAHLLETGQICEEILTLKDLTQASRLFAVNSVRRWLPAVLKEAGSTSGR